MKILSNIRAKVWSCVSIALLAYLAATLATSITNTKIASSLTHLEEVHFPMALKGEKALTLFKQQTKLYETGLLTGDDDEIEKANLLDDEISFLLDELAQTAGMLHTEFYPELLSLVDSYEDYFSLASEQYFKATHSANPFSFARELQRLGLMRDQLKNDFQKTSDTLTSTVVSEIKSDKLRAANNTKLLHILFIVMLVSITLVINLVANRLIIKPLEQIRRMIENFSRGKKVTKPSICATNDEICGLALSFWELTENLEQITVSKNYMNNIIDNMSDCLIVLNLDLTIQKINRATENLLNYRKEDLLNQPIEQIIKQHGPFPSVKTIFDELVSGKSISNIEIILEARNNLQVPVLFSGSIIYQAEGRIDAIVCLARDIRELKEDEVARELQSNYDILTGLPSRHLLLDRMQQSLNEAKRYQNQVALLHIDIDLFTVINETLGREAGDQILKETAKRLLGAVRETDTVARLKDDEFIILLNHLNQHQDAELVAQKILKDISLPFATYGAKSISASIGICFVPEHGYDSKKLLRNCDLAMYEAKSRGGNGYAVFSQELYHS